MCANVINLSCLITKTCAIYHNFQNFIYFKNTHACLLFKKHTLLTTSLKAIRFRALNVKKNCLQIWDCIFYSSTAQRQEVSDPDNKVTPVVISDLTVQEISYPDKVVVPVVISDLDLVRGAEFYK